MRKSKIYAIYLTYYTVLGSRFTKNLGECWLSKLCSLMALFLSQNPT